MRVYRCSHLLTPAGIGAGAVVIRDGVIVARGQISEDANEVVQADGALATPGWVDVHTHYDGQVTWDDQVDPSASHGVTTVGIWWLVRFPTSDAWKRFSKLHTDGPEWPKELVNAVPPLMASTRRWWASVTLSSSTRW